MQGTRQSCSWSVRSGLVFILVCIFGVAGLGSSGCNYLPKQQSESKAPVDNEEEAPEVDVHGPEPAETDIILEAQNRRVPVLMFHDLMEERGKGSVWYDCSKKEFIEILDTIEAEGFTVISCQDLYDHLTNGKEIPEKSIVLTFDDNYQSFYDIAWPILKERKMASTMFVHTGFVGKKEGRPKMDYDTLRELIKDPLFTVGGHTINHFLDLKDREMETQKQELEFSKDELESELGITVDFLAYPNGSNGEDTQVLARNAGYKMAFTIVNTPSEESPNLFAVGRYVHTRLKNALEDREKAVVGAPAIVVRIPWNESKTVTYKKGEFEGVKLKMVFGGRPSTMMSIEGREPVKSFVERAGAAAGINGGFFAMAAIRSVDNAMVGPLKTPEMSLIEPDRAQERWPKINNRPMVIWSDNEFAILPYIPSQMNKDDQISYFMKDYTDCFMGGVWLVRDGIPRAKDEQNTFASKDIQDYRRRAFIGITKDGKFVAGAATESVSSAKLAEGIAAAGVQEAVLIDSGFSTSLVYDGKIKASGHSSPETPSRPVPHAIVIQGELDPNVTDTEDLKSVDNSLDTRGKKKKKRK